MRTAESVGALPRALIMWAALLSTAMLLAGQARPLGTVSAFGGALVLLCGPRRFPLRLRLLLAAGVLLAPLLSPLQMSFLLAGAGWGVAAHLSARESSGTRDDLHHQLLIARRHGCPAAVAVWELPSLSRPKLAALQRTFRVTDSVRITRSHHGFTVEAVLDEEMELVRPIVEQRVALVLGRAPAGGWAGFPREGVTLVDLLSVARARAAQVQPSGSAGEGETTKVTSVESALVGPHADHLSDRRPGRGRESSL